MRHTAGADPEDDALDIIEEYMSGESEPFVQLPSAASEGGRSKRALKKVCIPSISWVRYFIDASYCNVGEVKSTPEREAANGKGQSICEETGWYFFARIQSTDSICKRGG
jgi:hypothetical protein